MRDSSSWNQPQNKECIYFIYTTLSNPFIYETASYNNFVLNICGFFKKIKLTFKMT